MRQEIDTRRQCVDTFAVRPEKLKDVAVRHFATHRVVISNSRNDNVSRENLPIAGLVRVISSAW